MPSREQSLRPEERNSHGISGDVFDNPPASTNIVSTPHGRVPHSREKSATYGDPVQPSSSEPVVSMLHGRHPVCKYDGSVFAETGTGDLWRKARNKTETQFQLRDMQRDRQLEIRTLRRKECIHRIMWLIQGFKFRSFILTNSLLHQHFCVGK